VEHGLDPADAPVDRPHRSDRRGRARRRRRRTRQAVTAAGGTPTATPWQRRAHTPPPKPTLHLGVPVDVSSSMRAYARLATTDAQHPIDHFDSANRAWQRFGCAGYWVINPNVVGITSAGWQPQP